MVSDLGADASARRACAGWKRWRGRHRLSGVSADVFVLMNRDVKYRRMTHLMEKNIRLLPEYPGFRMNHCIYGVQAAFHCEIGHGIEYKAQAALSY